METNLLTTYEYLDHQGISLKKKIIKKIVNLIRKEKKRNLANDYQGKGIDRFKHNAMVQEV